MFTLGGKKGGGKFKGMNIEKCMRNCTAGLPPILSKTLVLTASHSLRDTMLLTTFFIVFTCSMEHKHYYSLVTNVCSITLSTLHIDSYIGAACSEGLHGQIFTYYTCSWTQYFN